MRGDPSMSTESNDSGAPRYASMWSFTSGEPFTYPTPSWMMPQT
jgi:hypothetical protein